MLLSILLFETLLRRWLSKVLASAVFYRPIDRASMSSSIAFRPLFAKLVKHHKIVASMAYLAALQLLLSRCYRGR
jgi:hypothetical protein